MPLTRVAMKRRHRDHDFGFVNEFRKRYLQFNFFFITFGQGTVFPTFRTGYRFEINLLQNVTKCMRSI